MPRDVGPLVDPTHTVLMLQECQKGVVGRLSALPEMAEAAQREMVPNVVRLVAAARAAGVRVIHATAAHQPDMWGANDNARVFHGVLKSPVRLVVGAEAVEVLDEIGVDGTDVLFFRQHGLSPMQGTELDSLMRNAGDGATNRTAAFTARSAATVSRARGRQLPVRSCSVTSSRPSAANARR